MVLVAAVHTPHVVLEQTIFVWKWKCPRLWSQLLLIITSALFTDVHDYHAKTGNLHTLLGTEHHAESQQTQNIRPSLLPHFLRLSSITVFIGMTLKRHEMFFPMTVEHKATPQNIFKTWISFGGSAGYLNKLLAGRNLPLKSWHWEWCSRSLATSGASSSESF